MNTVELQTRITDIINLLEVAAIEAEDIKMARVALDKSSLVTSEREKGVRDREVAVTQKEKDIEAQKKYIEEQLQNNEHILSMIQKEKQAVIEQNIVNKLLKEEIDKEKEEIDIRKREMKDYTALEAKIKEELVIIEKEKEILQEQKEMVEMKEEANIREQKRLQGIAESFNIKR